MGDVSDPDPEPAPDIDALLAQGLPALRTFVRLRLAPSLRARESVEDLVQSTCREVLESADRFVEGGEAGFRRWIYTLAQRKIADRWAYHRAQKRDIGRDEPGGDEALMDQYGGLAGPGTQVASLEELRAIEAAFDRLREEDREVISLVRVLGMSATDAGACLGKNPGAVRTSLHRALARLAEELERESS